MKDKILLAHGSGGKLSHKLVDEFLTLFANPLLSKLDDSAVFELSGRLAFTTDSYTVSPIFFPGGDIGKLAVYGTVNDLAMCGAKPIYLSLSFIIEEGLPTGELKRIAQSVQEAASIAGVEIVTGDTKVVNQGSADKLFINTSGLGVVSKEVNISASNAKPGDKVILSGTVGDHGVAILSQREGFDFKVKLESDCAPLNKLVEEMLEFPTSIHCLRDPTRGGLATTLNELAEKSGVGIEIDEARLPIKEEVQAICELLGFDPLYLANEGKLVAIVAPDKAEEILSKMRQNEYAKEAEIIGEVVSEHKGRVVVKTHLGTSRIIDMLSGELLPRIC